MRPITLPGTGFHSTGAYGAMEQPIVTFVVPCYKLAHFLPDCIRSILAQSYRDFEILIMDDASPDHTAEVVRAFPDPRVRCVRNQPNLGHLKNYNKGIELARGKYVWLISADDYLRRPYVLEKYVDLLNNHPTVGYVFCAGVWVKGGVETEIVDYSVYSTRDRIVHGHILLKKLLKRNLVLAASGLVRRECYERWGTFPLNMPWAGDWFLWCLFALFYDVAYCAEPMVCYRVHERSMGQQLNQAQAKACCLEEIAIQWTIGALAEDEGLKSVARQCRQAVAQRYARSVAGTRFGRSQPLMNLEECEESVRINAPDVKVTKAILALVLAAIGNEYYWKGELELAKTFYDRALRSNSLMPTVWAKRLLLTVGSSGHTLRTLIRSAR